MYTPTKDTKIYPRDGIEICYENGKWQLLVWIGVGREVLDGYEIIRGTLQSVVNIYPRDKKHLEQIILAFNPE